MTTLTATEIRGIIEEKGVNSFDVIVTVPNNIFGTEKPVQKRMISTSTIGFELDIVDQFSFHDNSELKGMVQLKATLVFSEDTLSDLEKMESEKEAGSQKAMDLTGPISLDNLKLFAQQGINTFRVNLPSDYLNRMKVVQERMLADALSNEFHFTGIIANPIAENAYGIRAELYVPNFSEQIESHLKKISVIEGIYSSIEGYGTVRLMKPLAFNQLEELKSQIEESGELNFSYLIEISYDEIVDLDKSGIDESLLDYLLEEDGYLYISEIDHTVVGFNPATNKLIMKVTGEFSTEYLGSNNGCLL